MCWSGCGNWRSGCEVPPLSAKERDIHEAGLVSVLKEIHDDIDRAVFEAYGWADLAPALAGLPGATAPSPQKAPEQEEAEEELLARLVALNRERVEEEQAGAVRWLRPDYQIPKLAPKAEGRQEEADLAAPKTAAGKPAWPREELARIRALRNMLDRAAAPNRRVGAERSLQGQGLRPPPQSRGKSPRNPSRRRRGATGGGRRGRRAALLSFRGREG